MSAHSQDLISVEDFVRQTLEQISNALIDKTIRDSCISVKFDLGVIATNSKSAKTKGGMGLSVASVLKLGVSGQSSKEMEQTEYNRISFTIPLCLDPKKVDTPSCITY